MRFKEFEEEWEECFLSDILEFKNGLNPKANKFGKGTKFISVMDILNNIFITYDCIKATVEATEEEKLNFSVEKGDILFQRSSETLDDVGRANVYMDERPAIFGGFVIRGKKKGEYNPLFFRYLLSSPCSRRKIIPMGAGAQHFNIGQEGLSKVKLNFASLSEQGKIGKFLSLIDERIATQNKIIDKLESLIKGICNNYFLKLSHSQEMKSIRLGDILKERNEYCCKDGTFVHGTLSKDGLFPKTERWNRDFLVKEENKKYKITHLDDICYNPANLKFGVICRNIYGDLIFSPIYVTFEVSKKVNIGFIELYLTNRNFIEKIRKFEQGTVYERMSVSPEDFLSYKIRIPSSSEQTFFYQKIQRLKNCSQNELEHLNLYKKLRQYLLRQMFI
ncbi:restriction endonuclease subunit S [Hallella colorans]|nr:restriction endonuclease subunit S [Hallella colorans]